MTHKAVDQPLRPAPELHSKVLQALRRLNSETTKQLVRDCPELQPFYVQTLNHLQHVGFDFKIAAGSEDYVHNFVITEPLPFRPTLLAYEKAQDFFEIMDCQEVFQAQYEEVDEKLETSFYKQEKAVVKSIVDQPFESYVRYQQVVEKDPNASFVDFKPLVSLLYRRLVSEPVMVEVCQQYSKIELFRQKTKQKVEEILKQDVFPYTDTILVIEQVVEFFDVIHRINKKDTPALYHSARYEYYIHWLLNQKNHIFFPTSCALGATDLLKVRGVPLGFVGVNTDVQRVDGFWQTPYEFFHHDVNHSRRMFQFFLHAADKYEKSFLQYAEFSNHFIQQKLLPLLTKTGEETPKQKAQRIAIRMVLFEILHEDALSAHPEIIKNALLRPALMRTPFEYIKDNTVFYVMEPGATTLAYVFRKLFHTFYDTPEKRFNALGSEDTRSRSEIVNAALAIYKAIEPSFDKDWVKEEFEQLVTTDEGFPNDFFNEVIDDINQRDNHNSNFKVSKPLSVEAALKVVKGFGDKKVHSIFGFSDLAYAQPEELLQSVAENLKNLDPQKVLIAIGATENGIGKVHRIAKQMGFETVGIVSNKSLVESAQYSKFLDHLIVVKDTTWGGRLKNGEVAPTTRVFVETSESLWAYGGGEITLVSFQEVQKRNKPTQFYNFKTLKDGKAISGPAAKKLFA